ncbi:MAG: RNA polymerase sigma factor [Crocinitomicaceae bacterium]|mgnify:CR=1 FL=1|jgi:RNA polymerase sigma-70 factor (ECF subfamily)|nr:RNA polymerase sigma factor [Crocinitomicaceae bacterium]MBT5401999.1 RNA polymerase sigma factor [Crocinitomicaceae bacterium]MBT6028805.1 RNA polymerase sigma factor [Crocinitomicaceae bacterium]
MNENELIKALIQGDRNAFNLLVEKHKDMVFAVCFSFLNNTLDAEDTSQEVFIQIYKSIHQFKHKSTLKTWIYRIAISKSSDFIKKKKRKKRYAVLSRYQDVESVSSSTILTPQKILENKENLILLHQAIDLLSEKAKSTFILQHFLCKTNTEIAELLDMPKSTVDSHLKRSKEKIKKSLSGIL